MLTKSKIFKLLLTTVLSANLLLTNSISVIASGRDAINRVSTTDVLSIPTIFETADENTAKTIMMENIESIAKMYHAKKINDATIKSILADMKIYSEKKGKPLIYQQFLAGLMFRVHFNELGEIKNIGILPGGMDPLKPIKIETSDGKKYVWKSINNKKERANKNKAEFIIAFTHHLADRKLPVSRFVANDKNEYLINVNNCYYALSEFIANGKTVSGKDYSITQHRNQGKLAAQIQNAARDFKNPISDQDAKDEWVDPKELESILAGIKKSRELKPIPQTINIDFQAELYRTNFTKLSKNWKWSYIHADLNPGNIILDGDKVTGLIDFANSCYHYRIAEFIRIALGGSPEYMQTVGYNKENLKQAIIAFQQEAKEPLNESEIRGIIELTRFQLLLWTQYLVLRKAFVDDSFVRFAADFSTEQQISAFVKEIQNYNYPAETNFGRRIELYQETYSKTQADKTPPKPFTHRTEGIFDVYLSFGHRDVNPQSDFVSLEPKLQGIVDEIKQKLSFRTNGLLRPEQMHTTLFGLYYMKTPDFYKPETANDRKKDYQKVMEIARQHLPLKIRFQGLLLTPEGTIIAKGLPPDLKLDEMRQDLVRNMDVEGRKAVIIAHITIGRLKENITPQQWQQMKDWIDEFNKKDGGYIGEVVCSHPVLVAGTDNEGLIYHQEGMREIQEVDRFNLAAQQFLQHFPQFGEIKDISVLADGNLKITTEKGTFVWKFLADDLQAARVLAENGIQAGKYQKKDAGNINIGIFSCQARRQNPQDYIVEQNGKYFAVIDYFEFVLESLKTENINELLEKGLNLEPKQKLILHILKRKGGICLELLNNAKTDFKNEETKQLLLKMFYDGENCIFSDLKKLAEKKFDGQNLRGDFFANLLFKRNWVFGNEYSELPKDNIETITDLVYNPRIDEYLSSLNFVIAADNYSYQKAKKLLLQNIKANMDINRGILILKEQSESEFFNKILIEAGIIDANKNIQPEPAHEIKQMEQFFEPLRNPEMFQFRTPKDKSKQYMFDEMQNMFDSSDTTPEYVNFRQKLQADYKGFQSPGKLNKKNIVMSVCNFVRNSNGVSTYIPMQIANLLMRNDVTIHLLYVGSSVSKPSELKFGRGRVVFHPLPSDDYQARMALKLNEIRAATGIDAVMAEEPHFLETYSLLYYAKKMNIPSSLIYHLGGVNKRSKFAEYLILQHKAFSLADSVETVSDDAAEYAKWLVPGKATANIGPMLNVDTFNPELLQKDEKAKLLEKYKIPENAKNVIFLPSRLVRTKGTFELIRALKQTFIDNGRRDFHLVMIKGTSSDGKYFLEINKFLDDNHMKENVTFIPEDLNHEQMKYLYECSDLTVLPTYAEALGLVQLEAQLMEKPVLVFKIDGTPETFIDENEHQGQGTGYGVEMRDLFPTGSIPSQREIPAIVNRTSKVLEQIFPQDEAQAQQAEKFRLEMGKRARAFVLNTFEPKLMTSRFEDEIVRLGKLKKAEKLSPNLQSFRFSQNDETADSAPQNLSALAQIELLVEQKLELFFHPQPKLETTPAIKKSKIEVSKSDTFATGEVRYIPTDGFVPELVFPDKQTAINLDMMDISANAPKKDNKNYGENIQEFLATHKEDSELVIGGIAGEGGFWEANSAILRNGELITKPKNVRGIFQYEYSPLNGKWYLLSLDAEYKGVYEVKFVDGKIDKTLIKGIWNEGCPIKNGIFSEAILMNGEDKTGEIDYTLQFSVTNFKDHNLNPVDLLEKILPNEKLESEEAAVKRLNKLITDKTLLNFISETALNEIVLSADVVGNLPNGGMLKINPTHDGKFQPGAAKIKEFYQKIGGAPLTAFSREILKQIYPEQMPETFSLLSVPFPSDNKAATSALGYDANGNLVHIYLKGIPNPKVTKNDFANLEDINVDGLWEKLIDKKYIDGTGLILNDFKNLTTLESFVLDEKFVSRKKEIYDILKWLSRAEGTIDDLLAECKRLNLKDVILVGCSADIQLYEKGAEKSVIADPRNGSGSITLFGDITRRMPVFLVIKKVAKSVISTQLESLSENINLALKIRIRDLMTNLIFRILARGETAESVSAENNISAARKMLDAA